MKARRRMLIVLLAVFLAVIFGQACEKDTTKVKGGERAQAKLLVKKAVAFLEKNGKGKALAEFNKPDGQFVKDSLYVFAYDLNGTVIAHPKKPEEIGKNMLKEPDSQGKFFRRTIVNKAKAKGEGWVKYTFLNPATQKEEPKTTYFKKAGDMIVCCGFYN